MMQPGFSLATKSDIAQMQEIEAGAVRFPWTEQNFDGCFSDKHEIVLMEDAAKKALGFAVLFFIGLEIELLNICIKKSHQGQGLGKALLSQCIRRANAREGQTMFLEVRESNHAAQYLYESLGFNETGRRRNYYPAENGREDALLMALDLEFATLDALGGRA